mmetsp:Transcript_6123/g.17555  ORF Transcript_6123/g.17555 Transcript_6123/m.17555 type:complete len:298 (+) Transcript_6123:421-1314(+)|eukprot:CAMPEP_0206137476 /NCGR_PEP_ID=MMETSP1473-20131121/2590_1 /ASSEMBLY_ACC=CAM_ASM_001109 /TAXON_ID=1461547 /ORGANISM="Stichococcus sp, Strain RCC1054" /LENGTH=297 /DNA_ID=CAMNT_0053530579 /DNA_START=386 /DNA_END=1279 /DNA_ORIENTATION=+
MWNPVEDPWGIFPIIVDFIEAHIFWFALASFIAVFMPAWYPLLKPPPQLPGPFLSPDLWQKMPLIGKEILSHNTRRFRFALPHPHQALGLPIGQHISLRAEDEDSGAPMLLRPYTPVSTLEQTGLVDFVIKVYPEGKMSQHLDKMTLGDCILAKGPKGRFEYVKNKWKHIGMVAGGTGLTPMYQVFNHILRDAFGDGTRVSLIYANVTEADILMKKELDIQARVHGDKKFALHYVLNDPPAEWTGSTGFVTKDILQAHLPAPGPDTIILRCGPLPMNIAVGKALDELGYSAEQQFQF